MGRGGGGEGAHGETADGAAQRGVDDALVADGEEVAVLALRAVKALPLVRHLPAQPLAAVLRHHAVLGHVHLREEAPPVDARLHARRRALGFIALFS